MNNYNIYKKLIEYFISYSPISTIVFDKGNEISSESDVLNEGKLEVKALDDKIKELISN
jgi:hypothetical protein